MALAEIVDRVTGGAVPLDTREPHDFAAGHLRGAINVGLHGRFNQIPAGRPAVIVCRSGGRSNTIAQLLTSLGINAVNLAGGMRAWEQAGLPVVTDAGDPGASSDTSGPGDTMTASRPNILLIVTDEERQRIARPAGFSLPARERLAESGVSFDNYYAASAMCSSSRSVLYTGQHVVHRDL
jgi:rhodanese-related sulfurtransferase